MRAQTAKVSFDALTTAKRAIYATRDRTAGSAVTIDVPLAVTHNASAVRRFAGNVDRRVSRTPRDSRARITLRRVSVSHSKRGRDIDSLALARRMSAAFLDPRLDRVLRPKLLFIRPKITAKEARKSVLTVITIQQSTFKLRLFKNLKLVRTYKVAVGQSKYPTPNGRFAIQSKQIDPVWSVPNSPWAGELGGTTVSGGSASNPLKARWMGVAGSIGIHGTGQGYSIGTRASHGCIRMHVSDVKALYRRVTIGTTVLIRR